MVIDERLIEGGITPEILAVLIRRHEQSVPEFTKLYAYYRGKHDILNEHRKSKNMANNRVVCNHAKYIVDVSTAYLAGNPIKYDVSKGFDIEAVKNEYLEQDIAHVDSEIVKQIGIYGKTYELIYSNYEAKPRSAYIPPQQAFVVYNDDCTRYPLFGVYYYKTHDINGNVTGVVCNVYDKEYNYTYEAQTDSWEAIQETAKVEHYFLDVPLIEHVNNEDLMGDFESVMTLIDAYNKLQSSRVNDKEDFVNAFLFLRGLDLDSDQAKKLKEEQILMGYEDSDAKYLSKVLSESDVKVLRDDIKEDIHRFSMVMDLSDVNFSNNLSGVAIKYKILAFEQMIKNKEASLKRSLRKRFELYNNYLSVKANVQKVPQHRLDIIFTHNLPANNLETAQTMNYLKDDISLETKLGQFDFISDASEEAALVREEQKRRQEESAIYTKPININAYEDEQE